MGSLVVWDSLMFVIGGWDLTVLVVFDPLWALLAAANLFFAWRLLHWPLVFSLCGCCNIRCRLRLLGPPVVEYSFKQVRHLAWRLSTSPTSAKNSPWAPNDVIITVSRPFTTTLDSILHTDPDEIQSLKSAVPDKCSGTASRSRGLNILFI